MIPSTYPHAEPDVHGRPDLPLVSIAMPVRNNEKTLGLTIRSILSQTYQHWELLIIDDGSTDRTAEVARAFDDPRIRVWSEGRTLRLAARVNQAVGLARGAYIARMDGDDVCYPHRLERQLAYLQSHPDVDLAGTWFMVFEGDGRLLGKRAGPEQHERICAHPQSGFLIGHPTFMARADWFRAHPYDDQAGATEDQDLLLRAYRTSKYANVPEILVGVREGQLNLNKLLIRRRDLTLSFSTYFRRNGQWLLSIRTIAEQSFKAFVDVVAVTTGLHYRLLRHRARATTGAEEKEWEEVWRSLQG
jgi:glycosyltransferase involved in cell wall biosynthesis